MRTRQTGQSYDAAERFDGFGMRREPSVDRDSAYSFRGAPPEPVRVHPDGLHPMHALHSQHVPQYPPFGVVGPEQEFGAFPSQGYGPDASWHLANGFRGPVRHERDWGPGAPRYGGLGEHRFEPRDARVLDELRSRERMDRPREQELYRPHRGPHFGKGPKGYQRADDRIRDEICERLARDGYIDASRVEVAVAGGVVRLFGSVHHVEDRHAVERISLDVYGVQEVRSELRLDRGESQQAGRSSDTSTDVNEQGNRR